MKKPLIAGNWKMNLTREDSIQLLNAIKQAAKSVPHVELAVFPPYVFLEEAKKILQASPIQWGAQNVSNKESGAYTGEISSLMLKELGCHYVLIGHSERRHLFNEKNEEIAFKFMCSAQKGLFPIVCVGETLEERMCGMTFRVIKDQLDAILSTNMFLEQLLIAYEPVWAIGTGRAATPLQAQEVHEMIRSHVKIANKAVAIDLRILYGGSVAPENADELSQMPDINGALVGGASLNVQRFMSIAQQWKH